MGTRLEIDVRELDSARYDIARVTRNFASADRISEDVAGLTGHDALAGRVRDFADNWDIKRGQLQEGLQFVQDALQAIVQTFEDLDLELAGSIPGEAEG
ncbi:MAG TPA: hypothetical protein VFY91_12135 [Microbacterium sp.]|nr:hypothetical protein [Microbacterium sp.]